MVQMVVALLSLLATAAPRVSTEHRHGGGGGGGGGGCVPGHSEAAHIARYGHAAGAAGCSFGAVPPRRTDGADVLRLTSRGKGGAAKQLRWLGNETALIIIDMWHYHPCKTVTNRAGALVPRMNMVAAALRKAGGHVIYAPTDAAESFDGWPQREAVLSQPLLPVPAYAPNVYNGESQQVLDGRATADAHVNSVCFHVRPRVEGAHAPSLQPHKDPYAAAGHRALYYGCRHGRRLRPWWRT